MKDKLARVVISGLIAGIVMDIFDFLSYILKFSDLARWEWGSIVTFGRLPKSVGEGILGEISNLIFTMLLAILFVYVISKIITNNNFTLRGLAFGSSVWFTVNALAIMYKLPDLEITPGTAVSNLITSWIFGFTLTRALQWLDED